MDIHLHNKKPYKSQEKEYVKDYNHKYYSKNKEKWLEKLHCDCCHLDLCRASWNKHTQSKQHQRLSVLK